MECERYNVGGNQPMGLYTLERMEVEQQRGG